MSYRRSVKPAVIIFIRAARARGKIQIMSEEKRKNKSDNFVICDIQTEYAECLFKVLAEQFSEDYQFYLFHDAEKMLHFTEQSRADVLLIGEEYEKSVYESLRIGKVYVLTEIPGKQAEDGITFIYRYQAADRIVESIRSGLGTRPARQATRNRYNKKARTDEAERETLREAGSCESNAISQEKKKAHRIREEPSLRGLIGVYSPIHRIGKTRFALRMGEKIAEQIPVLYLNLEGYSGGSCYFGQTEGQDLGDLLYCLRQERTDYGLKISAMAGQSKGMDFIRPMKNELDLRAVKGQEWISLFETILDKCIYETVILDLGDCVDGLYDILKKCDRVYTPYIMDSTAMAKLEQYEENLRITGNEEILRHTVKKQMKKRKSTERNGGQHDKNRTAL